MARKSRKIQSVVNESHSSDCIRSRAALYGRLSVEDNGYGTDESIENQLELLRTYAAARIQDIQIVKEYVDNGSTGTNFERNAWKELIDDLKAGVINCIIVKDFSRIGRNYIEVGNYLEKIFPFLGTRVISINDEFDSSINQYDEKMLLNGLKNIVNEYYARDISMKVTQTKRGKQKRGEFNGAAVPYGYQKSKEDETKLEIDPETADIVRKIFAWRLQGKSCTCIGHYLDELLIPTPGAYRYYKGNHAFKRCLNSKWKTKHIVGILKDPVYLGHMAQGRFRASYFHAEGKMESVPKEEWSIVKNTHEALITQEQFDAVAKLEEIARNRYDRIANQNKDVPRVDNPFASKVICGQCGRKMTRRSRVVKGRRDYSFFCDSRLVRLDATCKNTTIHEEAMADAIRGALRMQFRMLGNIFLKYHSSHQENVDDKRREVASEYKRLKEKLEFLYKEKRELYSDLKEGILDPDEFRYAKEQTEKEICVLEAEIARKKEMEEKEILLGEEMQKYREKILSLLETDISFEMINTLVKKIEVYSPERIELSFSFPEPLEQLIHEWR